MATEMVKSANGSSMSLNELYSTLDIKILSPEENDNFFQGIIGLDEAKRKLSQVIKHFRNENGKTLRRIKIPHNFIFLGAEGIGKTKMACAFAKEANLPIIVVSAEKFISQSPIKLMKNFERVLQENDHAVVLIKEIEYLATLDIEKSTPVFSLLCDYLENYKECFFIATISTMGELPRFMFSEGRFDAIIKLELPDLEQREQFIRGRLKKCQEEQVDESDADNCIIKVELSDEEIKKIARDTIGISYGNIIRLINNAFVRADFEEKSVLDYSTMDVTLSAHFYGAQKKKMTEKERELTAYHEAGHVIAGYFSDPDNYKFSKVEIMHREESLGLTISEIDEEKYTYTKEDFENSIIMSFGGKAAEKIIFQTTTGGVAQDLADATLSANNMIKLYGMSDRLGPVCLDDEKFYSDSLAALADEILQEVLKDLYARTEKLLLEHKRELILLAEKLKEKEILYGDEILQLLKEAQK